MTDTARTDAEHAFARASHIPLGHRDGWLEGYLSGVSARLASDIELVEALFVHAKAVKDTMPSAVRFIFLGAARARVDVLQLVLTALKAQQETR